MPMPSSKAVQSRRRPLAHDVAPLNVLFFSSGLYSTFWNLHYNVLASVSYRFIFSRSLAVNLAPITELIAQTFAAMASRRQVNLVIYVKKGPKRRICAREGSKVQFRD